MGVTVQMDEWKVLVLVGLLCSLGVGNFLLPMQESGSPYWSRTYGGSAEDMGYDVVVCESGGYAVCGVTYSYGSGMNDAWLLRLDEEGNLVWDQTYGQEYGESALELVECSDGGFAFVGTTASYDADRIDYYLVRTASNGELEWERRIGGPEIEEGCSLIECSEGGFAVAGTLTDYQNNIHDMWLVRVSANGTTLWEQLYDNQTGSVDCYKILESQDGGFTLLGYGRNLNSSPYTLLVIHTLPNGSLVWSQTFDGYPSTYDRFSIIECEKGGYAILAQLLAENRRHTDLWFIRIDEFGNELWTETYGGDGSERSSDLVQTDDQGFMLLSSVLVNNNWEALLLRVADDGTLLWTSLIDSSVRDFAKSIVRLPEGGFVFVGFSGDYQTSVDLWFVWHTDSIPTRQSPIYHFFIIIAAIILIIIVGVALASIYMIKYNASRDSRFASTGSNGGSSNS